MNSAQTSSLSSVSPDEPVQFELELEELQQGGINLLETLGIAMQSLTANKLRTLLTALGIIIGVAAVIALMALGNGTSSSITETISANGANLITVRGGASSSGGVRGQVGSSQTITMRDAEALSDPIFAPSVSLVSPEYQSMAQLVAGSNNTNATVTGVYPAYLPVHNMAIEFGEFISENDVDTIANSVVLGANVATTLFPDGDSVGQSVRINGTKFTVTGVLESKGGSGFGSSDDGVFVPLSTAQRKLFGGRSVSGSPLLSSIAVQVKDADSVDMAVLEINQTMREQHDLSLDGSEDDFSLVNQQDILESVTQTTQTLTLFLGAIAAISLFVGGIGIMNIMLVSVRERTREIGLRKALGARESDILLQFMLEALIISLAGALIGLLIGVTIALIVNASGIMTATLSPGSMLLAVAFAMMVGLFFGIAPARSAARLNPIEALRYD